MLLSKGKGTEEEQDWSDLAGSESSNYSRHSEEENVVKEIMCKREEDEESEGKCM